MGTYLTTWSRRFVALALFLFISVPVFGQRTRDPQPERPPDTAQWPEAPPVTLLYDSRNDPPVEVKIEPRRWTLKGDRRFCKVGNTIDNTQFITWFEQVNGINATRVTVAAINGLAGVGPAYFEHYKIDVAGRVLDDIEGRHVIPPRYALLRRMSHGPDMAELTNWTYLPTDPALPSWAASQAEKDTAARYAFPVTKHNGDPVDIGPFNFFWHGHDLADSHGGHGVGPFHGGPDDWLVCPEGRKNREAEMLLEFQRPIWFLDEKYQPYSPLEPYWMGRTDPHEPTGYRFTLDDWCEYGERLIRYKFHDLSHLSRGTAGAAALAPFDVVGEACLEMVFTDFKTAHSLDPNHPGKDQGNFLLMPLWKKIELTEGPGNGGDRSLAHSLRLLRWCRPYFDTKPYDEAMRQWARKLSDQYGMTECGSPPWASDPKVLSHPLVRPSNYVFHQQLVTYEMRRFGGLDDLARRGAAFLTEHPPRAFEMRDGRPDDNVFDRHHTATADQEKPMWSYDSYGHFTHDVWVAYPDAATFDHAMQDRGINGSSQDYDCTPRSLWATSAER